MTEHRDDNDILDPKAMAAIFGVNQRTLIRMCRAGRAPMPIGGIKPPYRWRWGAVKKWHEAMETLYGVGFVGGKFGKKASENDSFEQNRSDDKDGASGPKKPR